MGCCEGIGKPFLITVNTLFVIFAVLLIVPGAIILADVDYLNDNVKPLLKTLAVGNFNLADLADGLAISMIAVGSVILIIALLGICGTCKSKRSCLCVYATIVLTLIILQVVGIALWVAMNKEAQDYLKDQMYSQLINQYTYSDLTTHEISTAWNYMFMSLECCAVNGVSGTSNDFDSSPWITGSHNSGYEIPIYCCSGITADSASATFSACTTTVTTGFYSVGCYDAFYNLLMKYSTYYIVVGVTIFIIEVLGVIFACTICKRIGKTDTV